MTVDSLVEGRNAFIRRLGVTFSIGRLVDNGFFKTVLLMGTADASFEVLYRLGMLVL